MGNPPDRPITLAPGHCLLFVYGQLQPGHGAPRSLTRSWPDRVRGQLFDLGRYPAAVRVGSAESWFCGHVLEIVESELRELDEFEGVHQGLYRRVRIITKSGFEAWIYEYARPLPPTARGPVEHWPLGRGNQ